MCVWLPGWPLQRICIERPELKQQTLLVFDEVRKGQQIIIACSRQALRQGVRPGMPKAEAEALVQPAAPPAAAQLQTDRAAVRTATADQTHTRQEPVHAGHVHLQQYDPALDREVLRDLALWCHRYTPVVGIEDSTAPECLLLNIAGTTHLFHNERSMARRVMEELQQKSLYVRVAVADTVGTACAVARYGTGNPQRDAQKRTPFLVPPGQQAEALQPLPPRALRLPDEVLETLNELDLRRIRQLLDLPRSTLPSRFGDILHQRLDQALGHLPETITPELPPAPTVERRTFDFPISHRTAIEITVEQLLQRTVETLQPQRHGVQRFDIVLHTESGETTEVTVGLIRPSVSVPHLMQLVRTRLERVQTPGDICEICVRLQAAAPLAPRQETLFACRDEAKALRERELLFERISNRMGESAVVRAQLIADAKPERAFRLEPLTRLAINRFNAQPATNLQAATAASLVGTTVQRPLQLTTRPAVIDVLSTTADGAPMTVRWNGHVHRIARSLGPERIQTGWWRDDHIVRDYYHVETQRGQQLWLFRNRRSGDWFLHGTFD